MKLIEGIPGSNQIKKSYILLGSLIKEDLYVKTKERKLWRAKIICILKRWLIDWLFVIDVANKISQFIIFTNSSAWVGYDTRSIFKQSLTGLNLEFSFLWTTTPSQSGAGSNDNKEVTLYYPEIDPHHWIEFRVILSIHKLWYFDIWRCLWCNGYCRRKWTQWHEFKPWMRLIAFHISLIPLGKVWTQLFSHQLSC